MRSARKPPPLAPGDVVGVAALSSAADPRLLDAGLEQLESLGYRVRPARNLRSDWVGFAGTDEERLAGFHELVAAPEVKAILFARGGHGLLRVMPGIDWDLLARHPKAYVGYSDLVPLLMLIVTRLGLVAFHGPMVMSDLGTPLDAAERDSLVDALSGRLARSLPCDCDPAAPAAGAVQGRLLGGCLAMLVATLATPWFPRLDGSLLFLEDVNEPLYRLDRMLTQLQLSGKLRRVKGMILGHLAAEAGVAEADGDPELWRRLQERSLEGAARRIVAWNLPGGHGRPNLTLPLGAMARLDPKAGALIIRDGAPGKRV